MFRAAAVNFNTRACDEFIDEIDAVDDCGDTALISVVRPQIFDAYTRRKTTEMAKYLINKGADVNVHNNYNKTALYYAIYHGNEDIFNLLVRKTKLNEKVTSDDNSYLHESLFRPHFFERLLKLGLDINVKNRDGLTPLHYYVKIMPHSDICDFVNYMIKMGADVNTVDSKNNNLVYTYISERTMTSGEKGSSLSVRVLENLIDRVDKVSEKSLVLIRSRLQNYQHKKNIIEKIKSKLSV